MITRSASETHHKFGPSSLDSLSLCIRFKYKECDDGSADEGTLLHKAFETGNVTGLDEEQASCVTIIREYVEALKFEDGLVPSDWEDYAEISLELPGLTFGTADRVLFCEKTGVLHIIDAKFTRVSGGKHSCQTRAYGAAFAECRNAETPGAVKTVVTHVVAPRLGPSEPARYDAELLIKDVRQFIESLYRRIEDPFEPPSPHEDLCAKCARASRCPALGRTVTTVSRAIGLPMPDVFAPESLVSPRDRAVAHVLAGALENWAEQVKRNNTDFVMSGGEIPGYRMTRRSTGLRVAKERTKDALDALAVSFDMPKDDLLGCCSITLGDVAKTVAFACGLTEAEAKERVRLSLGDAAVEGSCTFLQKEKRISDAALLDKVVGLNQISQ